MEDFQLDIVARQGPGRVDRIRLDLPRFTLVGATTRTGLITGPLRDRFGLVARLDYYDAERAGGDRRAGRRHPRRATSTPPGRWEIARRSRGTPRIANRLLRRVRDFAEVRGDGVVDAATARDGPRRCSASTSAASTRSTAPSSARCAGSSAAGRSGCRPWPSAVGEQTETVEDVYEPFLIQQGLLAAHAAGRVATPAA